MPAFGEGVRCAHRFGHAYARLWPEVEKIAWALLGEQAPADLVHDICVEITLSRPRFRHDCASSTWIYAIASHQVHNWIRRERKEYNIMRAAEQASLHSLVPRSDESENRFALVEALMNGLAALTETQRTCLFLVRCESRSSREVATLLKTTPTAVRMHIHRARVRLRQQLEQGD